MPAPAMFSKFKHVSSAAAQQNILENNPISQFFEVGKQTSSAGPELVWKIHDAYRKSDGKVSEIYLLRPRERFVLFFKKITPPPLPPPLPNLFYRVDH